MLSNAKDYQSLKQEAYAYCAVFVLQRAERIQKQIQELETALTSETKSSAGDKHETGRAMIQLEREKLGQQLAAIEKTQLVLSKVPKESATTIIGLGNLVVTSSSIYYMAISAGEYKSKNCSVYCISMATPIGQILKGKAINEEASFNNKSMQILAVY